MVVGDLPPHKGSHNLLPEDIFRVTMVNTIVLEVPEMYNLGKGSVIFIFGCSHIILFNTSSLWRYLYIMFTPPCILLFSEYILCGDSLPYRFKRMELKIILGPYCFYHDYRGIVTAILPCPICFISHEGVIVVK